jgi:hypothetical protein
MDEPSSKRRGRGKPREDPDVTRESFSITTHPRTREVMRRIAAARGVTLGKYLDGIFNVDLDEQPPH